VKQPGNGCAVKPGSAGPGSPDTLVNETIMP
jgi:hypothetical protein